MSERPFIAFIVAATLLSAIFIFFMACSLLLIKKQQHLKAKLYLQSLLNERENVMHAIAMELHDNVNQVLNIIIMDMLVLREKSAPENLPLIDHVNCMLDTLLIDTQYISHSLNPKYVNDIGFIPALQEKVAWLNITQRLKCTLSIEGERKKLPEQTELMILRIAQEAIQNALKYARAKSLTFHLSFNENHFEMRIADDGKGIEDVAWMHKKGSGIDNMYQRASIMKGELDVVSVPGSGTTIILRIPMSTD
jgi:two-component system, NarL family, sensor kinase